MGAAEARQESLGRGIVRRQQPGEPGQPLARLVTDQMLDLAAVDISLRPRRIQHLGQEGSHHHPLGHDRLRRFQPARGQLDHVVLVSLDPPALLQRSEIHRDAAAGDIEPPRDVRHPRPPAVCQPDVVNRQQVVGSAVGELVGLEGLPGLHWRSAYASNV